MTKDEAITATSEDDEEDEDSYDESGGISVEEDEGWEDIPEPEEGETPSNTPRKNTKRAETPRASSPRARGSLPPKRKNTVSSPLTVESTARAPTEDIKAANEVTKPEEKKEDTTVAKSELKNEGTSIAKPEEKTVSKQEEKKTDSTLAQEGTSRAKPEEKKEDITAKPEEKKVAEKGEDKKGFVSASVNKSRLALFNPQNSHRPVLAKTRSYIFTKPGSEAPGPGLALPALSIPMPPKWVRPTNSLQKGWSAFDDVLEEYYNEVFKGVDVPATSNSSQLDQAIETIASEWQLGHLAPIYTPSDRPRLTARYETLKLYEVTADVTSKTTEFMQQLEQEILLLENELSVVIPDEPSKIVHDSSQPGKGSRLLDKNLDLTKQLADILNADQEKEATPASTTIPPLPISLSAQTPVTSNRDGSPTLSERRGTMKSVSCSSLGKVPSQPTISIAIGEVAFKRVGHIGLAKDGSFVVENVPDAVSVGIKGMEKRSSIKNLLRSFRSHSQKKMN